MRALGRAISVAAWFAMSPCALAVGGTAVDQAVALTFGASHWDSSPTATLTGTEADPLEDPIVYTGWWYRAEGDTREYPLPVPDSESYVNGVITAHWDNLDGKDYEATEYTYVFDGEGPSGGYMSWLTVRNNALVPRLMTVIHLLDPTMRGNPLDDTAEALPGKGIKFGDAVDPSVSIRYRAQNPQHFQAGASVSILTGLLDADVDDLNDTGLPLAASDATAAFQFGPKLLNPGSFSGGGQVSVYSHMASDHVKGALNQMLYPMLVTRDPLDNQQGAIAMRRTSRVNVGVGFGVPGADWRVVGLDDFDGDTRDEPVMRNVVTGDMTIGYTPLAGAPSPPSNWTVGATGDFDADGKADILWRNTTSQKLVVWLMNGWIKTGGVIPSPDQAAASNWDVAGGADFDGDGARDILWYNQTSGNLVIWYMDANLVRLSGAFTDPPSVGSNNWRVVSVGDYGKGPGGLLPSAWNAADIVWQNDTSKKVVVWHMDHLGRRTSGTFTTPDVPSPGRDVIGPR